MQCARGGAPGALVITLHPISAGSGIAYLMRTVSGDDVKATLKGLPDHWTEGGDTPGEWMGAEAAALGLSGTVTQEDADAIFRDAVDPVSGQRMGRAWPRYTPADELYAKYLKGEPEASEARRQQLRAKADREGNRTARAGWEMVFSPVKSFSVLWAMADDEQRARLEAVERAAFEKVFALIEKEACWTRVGPTAAAQVQVPGQGFIGAVFSHRSSRAGDPDFHRHLGVSSKIRTEDGRWLALDARPLHARLVEFSEMYTAETERGMAAVYGVLAEVRQNSLRPARRPVREFLGVDDDVVRGFSKRHSATEAALASMTGDFRVREGREPSRAEEYKLAQAATLAVRPDKERTAVEEERERWIEQAREMGIEHPDALLQHAMDVSREAAGTASRADVPLSDVPARALRVLEGQRAQWTRSNAAAEIYRQLVETGWHVRLSDAAFAETVERATDALLDPDLCERLDAPDAVALPERFRRADGSSLFEPVATGQVFTSHGILAAEQELVEAAIRPASVRILSTEQVDAAIAAGDEERGFTPSTEQRQVVRNLLGSDVRVGAVIGPAGTGKTTIMRLVREAADAHGLPVLGLAGGQVQADNLAEEAGIRAENIARWRYMSERNSGSQWSLRPGQIVIVDEAGQASTPDLRALAEQVEAVGGRLLLVGDPRQLGSPGVGGALALIEADAGAQYLSEVRRFRDADKTVRHWEVEAAAAVSRGDADASFDVYAQRGRIRHGSADAMLDAVYTAWRQDTADGMNSVMIASNNALVAQLNERARSDLAARGEVDTGVEADLGDGNRAGAGDRVVTRANDRRLRTHDGRQWVRNGDTWTVEAVEGGGGITAVHDRTGRRVTLPAAYVGEAVELGYAVTKDRAQGLTVDSGHALFDSSMDRNGAYPALTRGRWANHAYLVTVKPGDPETGEPGERLTHRQVWQAVLRRDGTQQSATMTARRSEEAACSVRTHTGRLAFVLDQIADDRARHAVVALLGQEAAQQLLSAPAWPALRAQLGQLADDGFDTDRLLETTWRQRDFLDGDGTLVRDIAAVVHARNARAVDADEGSPEDFERAQDAPRPATAPQLLTSVPVPGDDPLAALGLVLPEAEPGDDPQTVQAARELAAAARVRAAQLGEAAQLDAEAGQGWAAVHGPRPAGAQEAAVWEERLIAAAVYRDLAGHDGPAPTGPAPSAGGMDAALRGVWRAAQPLDDPAGAAEELAAGAPVWLDTLGPRPGADEAARKLWDRAAWAAYTYRRLWDFGHESVALGERPADPVAAADYEAASAAITAWRAGSGIGVTGQRLGEMEGEELRRADWRGRSSADRVQRVEEALAVLQRAETAREVARQAAQDATNRAQALRNAGTPQRAERAREMAERAAEAHEEAAVQEQLIADARETLGELAPGVLEDRERVRRGADAQRELARRTLRGTPDEEQAAASAQVPPWQERPHGRLTDVQLREAHRRALEAARAAESSATEQEALSQRLAAEAVPGGRIEQRVTAQAARVEAIHRWRTAQQQAETVRRQAAENAAHRQEPAARLAATHRMGVPAVRGAERRALEERLHRLEEQAARLAEQLAQAEQAGEQAAVTAGEPARHEQLLADWQEAGGEFDAALARARTTAGQDAEAAAGEAGRMRERSRQLRDSAAAVRREQSVRATLPDDRRAAEQAARAQQPRPPQQRPAPPAGPQQRPDFPRRDGPRRAT
ncbi:relaxase domain-containing protein (plasmid) [Streptomyces sp. NBC_01775]|uniref:MobF family relaxase n=1 Tax=Streptomyces sp. NBC_01775 TaxID=2975939 RepID=UPI002DD8FA62|nr:MobF family relaxase [Streptomyces sp. NBC_01775]WSB82074.1 relaxase domain-containing protein [Streptomyces sp. NBC_01775]